MSLKKFFILMYVVLVICLIVVTPFDLRIAHLLYGEKTLMFRVISDIVYLPAFLVGYLGVFYYYQRFKKGLTHKLLQVGLVVGTIFGILILSVMFIHTLRFFPYYLYVSPIFLILLLIVSWIGSAYIIRKKILAFDYLFGVAIGMLVTLFLMVMSLKRVFGRARFYVVFKNEEYFTNWYEFHGLATTRGFYSMPSGHTTFVAIALWFVLVSVVIPEFRKYSKYIMIAVGLWIIIQAYIRLLFGEHFLTDVIFSLLLSIVVMHTLLYVSMYMRGYLERKFNI